jgi:hypothetical protein
MRARGVKYCPAPLLMSWAFLSKALVGVALDVRGHAGPGFLADQLHDQLAQLGWVLDLVLGLAEDEPEHPALPAELLERPPVVRLQPLALHLRRGEIGPAMARGDRRLHARQRRPLVGHLEKEEGRELLQVVLV